MGYKQRKNIEFVDGGIPYLLGQIAERDKELKDLQKEVASLAIESIEREKTLARLEAEVTVWAKAEQEGRLVALPCKTGDTIYQLRGKRHALGEGVSPRIISCAQVWSDGDYELLHQGATPCTRRDFGKTWFLTREEAEAALKGGTA